MAIIGAGAILQVSIATVYTTVAGIVSIEGPSTVVTDVDVSHLLSTNAAKEFIPGMSDGGVVNLEANYTNTVMSTLYGFLRTTQIWRITFSDSSKWDFSGHINAISTVNPLDDKVTMPFSIKVTGKPTFTS